MSSSPAAQQAWCSRQTTTCPVRAVAAAGPQHPSFGSGVGHSAAPWLIAMHLLGLSTEAPCVLSMPAYLPSILARLADLTVQETVEFAFRCQVGVQAGVGGWVGGGAVTVHV